MDEKAPGRSAILLLGAAWSAIAAQPAATDFKLTPQRGQDQEQQWFDRYDCDARAKRESGYAPTGAREDEAAQQAASEEYRRTMVACLTQHGYDVRFAQPGSPLESPPAPSATSYAPSVQREPRVLSYRPLSVQAGGGYTFAAGSTGDYLHDGANAGAALTWFPSATLPLGVRVEASYTWLKPASQLLALTAVGYNNGQVDLYGGDFDLRLNLAHLPARQQLYLIAGAGWYRLDTTLQKVSRQRVCGVNFCSVFTTLLAAEHDTSPYEPSWNVGLGWETALDSHTSLFVEMRYRRILHYSNETQLVPVWLGLRF